MKRVTAVNVRKMMELADIMRERLCTHENYLEATKSEMESRELVAKQAREIARLNAVVDAGIRKNEKLTKSYFQNNERLRIVRAYNTLFDDKKLDEQKIQSLLGDIGNLKAEIKSLKVKCATLSMEAGERADDIDSSRPTT